jgi:hypothetical protein
MYVTFRLGSLIQLLVLTAVAAAFLGMLLAGRSPESHSPSVIPPSIPRTTTQDMAPLGGINPGP